MFRAKTRDIIEIWRVDVKKILVLTLVLFLFSCTSSSSEVVRESAVAGAFYPADKEELTAMIGDFLDNTKEVDVKGDIIAVVVPHAGYVYSGHVAAHGFKQLQGRKINTVAIICNSHTAHFAGIVIDDADSWKTPLGIVEVDKRLTGKLVNASNAINYNKALHQHDHTIEVQIPFLQTVLKGNFKIAPILFGNSYDDSYKELARVLATSLGRDDIVVISTDMSHYPNYEDANKIDQKTLEMIKEKDVAKLEEYIEKVKALNIPGEQTLCCGIDGVKTAIELSNILGAEFEILRYANSGDVEIGDKSRVVGYGSLIMYIPKEVGEKEGMIMKDEYLSKEEKVKLLQIAKASIIEAVTGNEQPEVVVTGDRLRQNCGAFVTIKKHGQLRGCIGYIIAVKPLYQTVEDVAKSAAISDPRFRPMSEEELKDIEIEISALTPLKRIYDVNEIEVGKHGIVIKKGFYSGLLLPQVATEYGWDRNTFLEHTCMKAGLPKDAWRDESTEIQIFSAEVFSEGDVE